MFGSECCFLVKCHDLAMVCNHWHMQYHSKVKLVLFTLSEHLVEFGML